MVLFKPLVIHLEHLGFDSQFSILDVTHVKKSKEYVNALSKVVGSCFSSGYSGFLPQEQWTGWVR